jgi:hypothetical protein
VRRSSIRQLSANIANLHEYYDHLFACIRAIRGSVTDVLGPVDVADGAVNHRAAPIEQQPYGMSQRAFDDWALAAGRERERDAVWARARGTGLGGHGIARRIWRAIQCANAEPCAGQIRHMLVEICTRDYQQRMLSFSASHNCPLSGSSPVSRRQDAVDACSSIVSSWRLSRIILLTLG